MKAFSRRQFLSGAAAVAASGTLPRTAAAAELPNITVEQQTFIVPDLDPAHDGLRIVQLSDLHVGPLTGEPIIRAAIAAANAWNPDLVVLTGDFLCHDKKGVGVMKDQLGGLRAPTVAILGNHDHWVDAGGSKAALVGHGYTVLQNQHESVTLKGAPFTIIGVDDLMTKHADPVKSLRGAPKTSRIALAHVPRTADLLAETGESLLCLSGHTHGGQVNIPGLTQGLMRGLLRERYDRGRFLIGGVQLYVNRGIGLSGFPVRINATPELTVLTLRAPMQQTLQDLLNGFAI